MVTRLEDYPWSSYQKILKSYQGNESLVETALIRHYFPTIGDFIHFSEAENQDDCLEIRSRTRLSDGAVYEIIKKNHDYQNLGALSIEIRNHRIQQIHQETGASIRQLSRVLGLGKMIVERALKSRI